MMERMINEAVTIAVVELIRCNCKKGSKNNLCCCRKANLSCNDACLCNDSEQCGNNQNLDDSDEEEEF